MTDTDQTTLPLPEAPAAEPDPTPAHMPLNVLRQDLDFDIYRKADGINATGLKEVLRSPAHYKVWKDAEDRPETEAQRFGKLVHLAVLERERFEFCKVVRPELNLRTNKGKEDLAKWQAEQDPHAVVMLASDVPRIDAMLKSVAEHAMLKKLLSEGMREVSVWWTDPATQVLCKGRLDFISQRGIAVDLKTTKDARPELFRRDINNNMYHLQAAHYLKAGDITGSYSGSRYVFIALEKEPPYALAVYTAGPSVLGVGEQWREHSMGLYADSLRSGVWPGYPQNFTELDLPPWAAVPEDVTA